MLDTQRIFAFLFWFMFVASFPLWVACIWTTGDLASHLAGTAGVFDAIGAFFGICWAFGEEV